MQQETKRPDFHNMYVVDMQLSTSWYWVRYICTIPLEISRNTTKTIIQFVETIDNRIMKTTVLRHQAGSSNKMGQTAQRNRSWLGFSQHVAWSFINPHLEMDQTSRRHNSIFGQTIIYLIGWPSGYPGTIPILPGMQGQGSVVLIAFANMMMLTLLDMVLSKVRYL